LFELSIAATRTGCGGRTRPLVPADWDVAGESGLDEKKERISRLSMIAKRAMIEPRHAKLRIQRLMWQMGLESVAPKSSVIVIGDVANLRYSYRLL